MQLKRLRATCVLYLANQNKPGAQTHEEDVAESESGETYHVLARTTVRKVCFSGLRMLAIAD